MDLNQTATSKDHPNFASGPLPDTEVEQILSSVLRQEAVATSQEEDDLIAELNGKHAVVMVGGKCSMSTAEPKGTSVAA